MKRLVIVLVLFGIVFNSFALELSEVRKSNNESSVLELLEDTEESDNGYDWIVIPTLDTEPRPVDLPNKDMYKEKEKKTLNIFSLIRNKVREILEKQE